MKKQNKLETLVGCACIFGTLGIVIYKAIKNGRTQRKALDEQSAKREQEFNEFMENSEKERKEAEEKHQENMKKLDDLDTRCNERLNNAKDFDELIKAGNECIKDIQMVSAEVFKNYPKETTEDEGIYKHETKIVFKGKLAEMMEKR